MATQISLPTRLAGLLKGGSQWDGGLPCHSPSCLPPARSWVGGVQESRVMGRDTPDSHPEAPFFPVKVTF